MYKGADVQRAEKVPMSRDRLEKQMKKTGNTPFVFEQLDIQMDEDIFLPVQALNELRRQALGMLEAKLLESGKREEPERLAICSDTENTADTNKEKASELTVYRVGDYRNILKTAAGFTGIAYLC